MYLNFIDVNLKQIIFQFREILKPPPFIPSPQYFQEILNHPYYSNLSVYSNLYSKELNVYYWYYVCYRGR